MKNLKVFLLILCLLLVMVSGGQAQSPAANSTMKIGYANLTRIFDEYNKTKEYDTALEAKYKEYQQIHNDKMQKIKDAESKLSVMKEDEKAKLQTQMDKDKSDVLAFDREKETDLRKDRADKMREILGDIDKVVKEISQKEGYTLVFNDKVLLYNTENMDITVPIIKTLNERYPAKAAK